LRDLNAINVSAKSTKFAFTISLIMPLIMGLGGWALADGAAPTLPLRDNYLEMLSFGIIAIAIVALPIPHVFKWNWETRYFGALMFSLGSFSIMGIYPLLCIIQFSPLPLLVRLSIALLVSVVTIRWCARIVKTYKAIYADKRLFNCIYEEESTAVYYLQQGDRKIFEKKFKLNYFQPQSTLFVAF
jgi:hypothetical protein